MSWSHFLELIYLKDTLQRYFYSQMCAPESWEPTLAFSHGKTHPDRQR
ncbi:hypothetical protein [Halomonas sp. AOP42-E1-30]